MHQAHLSKRSWGRRKNFAQMARTDKAALVRALIILAHMISRIIERSTTSIHFNWAPISVQWDFEGDAMWKRTLLSALIVVILSCSGDAGAPALFQGDPGLQSLPASVNLGPIVGGAPPAAFTSLKYENHYLDKISGKTSLPYTSLAILSAHERQIAVTQTEYFISQPDGSFSKQVTDIDVGIPGIISLVYLTTKQSQPQQVQFRKVVRQLENIAGRLFPLATLNQLSVDVIFAYQVTRGRKHQTARELRWSYRFRVLGHYEGYHAPSATIPGKIYIIDRQEIDPEGSVDNTLIHFAESLGAVVKTVRQGEKFLEETRLVDIAAFLTNPKEL